MAEQQKEQAPQGKEATEAGASLIEEIADASKTIRGSQETRDVGRRAIEALMKEMLGEGRTGARVNKAVVDDMIVELDRRMSAQLDVILHHPEVQKLESSWRALKLLIDRTDFRENVKIEVLNVSKEDLLNDFEDSPEVVRSGLYKHLYTAEYGQFGGQPYGAMIAQYAFTPGAQDMKLLQYCAGVAAMAHAPFISSASPQFFGEETWLTLPNLKDLHSIFEGPQYAKWRSFRETEDARCVGLTAPRFLLRLPYGPDSAVKEFNYQEDVTGANDHYLWGNSAFTLATRITDSFAKYRWCPNIIGPQSGGAVEDLPVHVFKSMGALEQKIPTEILLSERREFELSEEGFIGLTMRKGSDNACFFSANSCQKPKTFPKTKEGKEAEGNYKLGTQLPYMFIVGRLAHYIKVIQRENIGSWKEKSDLNRELNTWIKQYVSEMENPGPGVRSRRPLREAEVVVSDVEGDPGWYKVDLRIRPHFKYMGAFFTLSLVGKLDKK
jgi:type VI secretion system protein ImpC